VKVSAGRIDSFVANPDPAITAYLVYGPNTGLAFERAQRLILSVVEDPNDPFRVSELSPSAISDTPSRLADELLAMSFGGGERLVVIRDAPDSLSSPLADALDAAAKTGVAARLVLEAGNLSGRSALRKLCESRDDCAALPCYPDDEDGRAHVVRSMMHEADMRIGPDALRTLTGILGDDRQLNRREIEKLILFIGPGNEVSEDDVLACVGDSGSTSLDETVLTAADGNIAELDRALERFWSDGGDPVNLVRATQRHFQRLHRISGLMNSGESYENAVRRLRPPVFWKMAARFQSQCRNWSSERLELALGRLTEAELALKTTGTPGRAACSRTLYAIASMQRARRA